MDEARKCADCPLVWFCTEQERAVAQQRDELLPLATDAVLQDWELVPAMRDRMQAFDGLLDQDLEEPAQTVNEVIDLIAKEQAVSAVLREAVFRVLNRQRILFRRLGLSAMDHCKQGTIFKKGPDKEKTAYCTSPYREQAPNVPSKRQV